MERFLVECVLAPDGVLAEVPAVVAPEDDDGVFLQAELFQMSKEPGDLVVRVGNAGGVGEAELVGVTGIAPWIAAVSGVLAELAAGMPGGKALRLFGVRDGG